MKIITRVRNFFFLKDLMKGKQEIDSRNKYKEFLRRAQYAKIDYVKDGCERNMLAAIIQKYRKIYPHISQGWAEAEKTYKEYLIKENSIKSFADLKEGDYLTRISNKSPIKGTKLFEYYVNQSWNSREKLPYTVKLTNKSKKYGYYNVEDSDYGEGIYKDNYTSYIYSTAEEIKEYEHEKRRQWKIQKEIDKKYEEINKLKK